MSQDTARLLDLVTEPERLTGVRLWRRLPPGHRAEAAEALLRSRPETDPTLRDAVARARRFRIQTVEAWPTEKVAHAFERMPYDDYKVIADLLTALHLEHRRPVMATFLNALGVEHEDGELVGSWDPAEQAEDEDVSRALRNTVAAHGAEDTFAYLLTLIATDAPIAPSLMRALSESHTPAEAGRLDASEPPTEAQDQSEPPVEIPEGLRTLDSQIIFATVDATQGVEGAFQHDAVDDLIEELISLNSHRHQSYFHAGFRDVLFDRALGRDAAEMNVSRNRWYWTGVLQGLARRAMSHRIVTLFDEEPVVAALGDGEDQASNAAAPHVVHALDVEDRSDEIEGFLRPPAVVAHPAVIRELLDIGTSMLRSGRPEDASRLLRSVDDAITSHLPEEIRQGLPITLEIKRRRAHCMRELGEFQRAADTLEHLMRREPDPNIRSSVLADLGLVRGSFRRLSDVVLPSDPVDIRSVRERLAQGEELYRESVGIDVPRASHGHYCLGVAALLDEDFGAAVRALERARSGFRSARQQYEGSGLLRNADLYLGIALAAAVESERLEYAARLIESGLRDGAVLPPHFATEMLQGLDLGATEALETVAAALLDCDEAAYLDLLADSPAVQKSERVVDALLERSGGSEGGGPTRARRLRSALPFLVRHGRSDHAEAVLDTLESLALDEVGRSDFLSLLENEDLVGGIWDTDDRRISQARMAEASADYAQAATLLSSVFHRVLAKEAEGGVSAAFGILERIAGYGVVDEAVMAPLRDRLAAQSKPPRVTAASQSSVRVLFVGGDERQAQRDESLRDEVKQRDPSIRVDFLHSGWSSNWGPLVEDFERRSAKVDAVVLMRFMRTGFGRAVRKACPVPWRACWGPGLQTMALAIVDAAEAGREAGR